MHNPIYFDLFLYHLGQARKLTIARQPAQAIASLQQALRFQQSMEQYHSAHELLAALRRSQDGPDGGSRVVRPVPLPIQPIRPQAHQHLVGVRS